MVANSSTQKLRNAKVNVACATPFAYAFYIYIIKKLWPAFVQQTSEGKNQAHLVFIHTNGISFIFISRIFPLAAVFTPRSYCICGRTIGG